MLKRSVAVRANIIVSVSEEKRVADFVVALLAINKRVGGQKARSKEKKKRQKSKDRKGVGYDQETPLINQLILSGKDNDFIDFVSLLWYYYFVNLA